MIHTLHHTSKNKEESKEWSVAGGAIMNLDSITVQYRLLYTLIVKRYRDKDVDVNFRAEYG